MLLALLLLRSLLVRARRPDTRTTKECSPECCWCSPTGSTPPCCGVTLYSCHIGSGFDDVLRKRFSNYNEVRYSAEKKWTLFTCGRTPQAATCHQINQQTNQNKYISNIIAIISLNTLPHFFFVSWRIKPFD